MTAEAGDEAAAGEARTRQTSNSKKGRSTGTHPQDSPLRARRENKTTLRPTSEDLVVSDTSFGHHGWEGQAGTISNRWESVPNAC